ncbi:MAG: hypothetical protein KDD47_00060 [Acidobacteria bacterium]|nr:hypothetical protein [Acidobacteriota bacterium]
MSVDEPAKAVGAGTVPALPKQIRVTLSEGDFLYFNWVLGLERPILPFFLYGFIFFNLASLLGVWPAGRTFALAILVPAVGYSVWLTTSAKRLWRTLPQIRAPRSYRFREENLTVEVDSEESILYGDLVQVLESRRGIYLNRPDGSHEILPKKALPDPDGFVRTLRARVPTSRFKRSTFL